MKVLTIYWADTRRHFAHHWQYNQVIVKHNYATYMRDLPADWDLTHHMFINRRDSWPDAVQGLTEYLSRSHSVTIHVTNPSYMRHMFNSVLLDTYRILGLDYIQSFDRIMHMQHDHILICHSPTNALVLLEETIAGNRPDLAHYYDADHYDYVSHWIASPPQWGRFQHNTSVGPGYLRASKAPLVFQSCQQDRRHGEEIIYREMGERGLFMQKNTELYFGDYAVSWLNVTRLRDLMACVEDYGAFQEIVETAGGHIRGSLHPFLGRRRPDGT